MGLKIRFSSWVAAAWVVFSLCDTAQAAVAECAHAKTVMEHTICSGGMQAEDKNLGVTYRFLTKALLPSEAHALEAGQRQWLQKANNDAGDVTAIMEYKMTFSSSDEEKRYAQAASLPSKENREHYHKNLQQFVADRYAERQVQLGEIVAHWLEGKVPAYALWDGKKDECTNYNGKHSDAKMKNHFLGSYEVHPLKGKEYLIVIPCHMVAHSTGYILARYNSGTHDMVQIPGQIWSAPGMRFDAKTMTFHGYQSDSYCSGSIEEYGIKGNTIVFKEEPYNACPKP